MELLLCIVSVNCIPVPSSMMLILLTWVGSWLNLLILILGCIEKEFGGIFLTKRGKKNNFWLGSCVSVLNHWFFYNIFKNLILFSCWTFGWLSFCYTIIKPTMIMIVGFNSGGTTISLGKIRDLWWGLTSFLLNFKIKHSKLILLRI